MAARATKAAAKGTTKPPAKAAPAKAASPGTKSVADAKPASKARAKPATPTVTMKQLSAEFGERQGMDKKQAEAALAGVFGMLVAHLKSDNRVRIAGLGITEVKNRLARMGSNPEPARRFGSRPARLSRSARPRVSRTRSDGQAPRAVAPSLSCPCVSPEFARHDLDSWLSRPETSASPAWQFPQVDEVLVMDRISGIPEDLQHAHAHGRAPLRRFCLERDHHLLR